MQLIQSMPFEYPVLMVSSSDHVTGKTGVPLTVYLSKNGGTSVLIAPTVTEIGFGKYAVHLVPEYVDTIGAWSLHVEAPGCDPFDSLDQVISVASSLIPPGIPLSILDSVKWTIGIADDDLTNDRQLVALIKAAFAAVEGTTLRRFREPVFTTRYVRGNGQRELWIAGNIDDSINPDGLTVTVVAPGAPQDTFAVPIEALVTRLTAGRILDFGSSKFAKLTSDALIGDETLLTEALPRALDPGDQAILPIELRVFRRALCMAPGPWEELAEDVDWERRGNMIVFLTPWRMWFESEEFRLEFYDGYVDPPDDIKQVIVEIVADKFLIASAATEGNLGVKSESLGDFSYSVDFNALLMGTGKLTDAARLTLKRYQRVLV